MNWMPEHHIVTFLRAEGLHQAQKADKIPDLQRLYKWLSTRQTKLAARGYTNSRMAHVQQ